MKICWETTIVYILYQINSSIELNNEIWKRCIWRLERTEFIVGSGLFHHSRFPLKSITRCVIFVVWETVRPSYCRDFIAVALQSASRYTVFKRWTLVLTGKKNTVAALGHWSVTFAAGSMEQIRWKYIWSSVQSYGKIERHWNQNMIEGRFQSLRKRSPQLLKEPKVVRNLRIFPMLRLKPRTELRLTRTMTRLCFRALIAEEPFWKNRWRGTWKFAGQIASSAKNWKAGRA